MDDKPIKIYILTHWSFNEPINEFVTFSLEDAEEWASQECSCGYNDYEEIDVYDRSANT